MVAAAPQQSPVVPSALVAACLARRPSEPDLLQGLAALAQQDQALCLRLAMVLAWVKRQDLLPLGYTSFSAFCRERVDWGGSWVRALLRLVESPLDQVKRAVCGGLVPLRVAVGAPGRVSVEGQAAWLLDPSLPLPAPRQPTAEVDGADAEVIARARAVARIFIGRRVSIREVELATVPALAVASVGFRSVLARSPAARRGLAAVVLVAGLGSLAWREGLLFG